MQIKRIKCPNCSVVLDVKNSKNETLKLITCPSCKAELQVKFAPQQAPLQAHTFIATPKSPSRQGYDYGATQLVGRKDDGSTQLASPTGKTMKAELCFRGVSYPLDEGKNIVGRMASTSQANVQIATDDRYMSRQHVAITLSTLPDGSTKAVLSNYQNKNTTAVDGQPVETGDAIRLTDGNRITMGRTTVIFKTT